MENVYDRLKNELICQNVRIKGFGAWLKTREDARRLGVNFIYEYPDNGWGHYSYEKTWEKVYHQLCKNNVNIVDFADYLLGLTEMKKRSGFWGQIFEPFVSLFS